MQLAPVCYTVHVSWTLNLNGYSESSTCFIHVNLVSKINAIPVSPCFMGLVAQILATFEFLLWLGLPSKILLQPQFDIFLRAVYVNFFLSLLLLQKAGCIIFSHLFSTYIKCCC